MAIVVVGGHTRDIGKTSVMAGLIAATTELRWTAIKITQFGHGVCSANGAACDCDTGTHPVAVSEERAGGDATTDSGRYLASGAIRSLWVRTRQGQLVEAMRRIRREIVRAGEEGGNVMIESNSILRFVRPTIYLSVVNPEVRDFKESALRYLDRADAVLAPFGSVGRPTWERVSLQLLEGTPILAMRPPVYVTKETVDFVRQRLVV